MKKNGYWLASGMLLAVLIASVGMGCGGEQAPPAPAPVPQEAPAPAPAPAEVPEAPAVSVGPAHFDASSLETVGTSSEALIATMSEAEQEEYYALWEELESALVEDIMRQDLDEEGKMAAILAALEPYDGMNAEELLAALRAAVAEMPEAAEPLEESAAEEVEALEEAAVDVVEALEEAVEEAVDAVEEALPAETEESEEE